MRIRHGLLLDVLGHVRQLGPRYLCPALVEIVAPGRFHPPAGFVTMPPDILRLNQETLWVRARLTPAFGFRPLQITDAREYLLEAGFVAVLGADTDSPEAVPFACSDRHSSQCPLTFSEREDAGSSADIAAAFWGLLAATEPAPFRAEGLWWPVSLDPAESDGSVETYVEASFSDGVYDESSTEFDPWFDTDSERPNWNSGQWRCRWSRPVRRYRNCRRFE